MAQIGIRPSTRVIKLKDLPVGDVFSKKNIFYIMEIKQLIWKQSKNLSRSITSLFIIV